MPTMLTKGLRALGTKLIPSTPQVSQNTVAHGSKKETTVTTAPLSTGSKSISDFIIDFRRADKNLQC